MERLIDKTAILACAACCTLLVGATSAGDTAVLLLVVALSSLTEVAPRRAAAVAVIACGATVAWMPETAALGAIAAYDGARLLLDRRLARGVGAGASRASMAPASPAPAVIFPLIALACLRLRAPGALTALTVGSIALSTVLALRTGLLIAHRKREIDARDELSARARALGIRNRQLAERLEAAHDATAQTAGIDKRACFPQLTQREFEVAALVAEGLDNREIAARSFMSEGTVRNTICSALAKLHLKNRTQIAIAYLKAGQR